MNRPVAADREGLARAASLLRAGGVVAFPTETYYGLAVDPFNRQALDRLFVIKRRPRHLPILVLVSDRAQLSLLTGELPTIYHRLIERFWPAPLTLVCPALPSLPSQLTGDTRTVGLRQSPNETAAALIAAFGGPMTATSANLTGCPAAVSASEVARIFGDEIDLIIDGGVTPGGCGSTLVGLNQGELRCIREGRIVFAAVQEAAADFFKQRSTRMVAAMADIQWDKDFALEQTAGDEELLMELINLFRTSSVGDYIQLQRAVADGDAEAVVRAAHSLKGAAATLGLEGIRWLAGGMEDDGRRNSVAVARENLATMGELLEQLKNL